MAIDTSLLNPSLTRDIKARRKVKTVLFTDMIGSTKLWERYGNIDGRLLINRHNKLIKPILARFKGKVVKSIGDSFLTVFNSADDAVRAAIAVQQTLAIEKYFNASFPIQLRIGIHTGEVILEDDDVYGDTVNVASRIEQMAKANQIMISEATFQTLKKQKNFSFKKFRPVRLKGKKKEIQLYQVHWQKHERLDQKVTKTPYVQLVPKQKYETLLHLCCCLIGFYYFLNYHIVYLLLDFFPHAGVFLHEPLKVINDNKYLSIALIAVLYILVTNVFIRPTLSSGLFRLFRGGFVGVVFYIATISTGGFLIHFANDDISSQLDKRVFISLHHFVEIVPDKVHLYEKSHHESSVVLHGASGDTFPLLKRLKKSESDSLQWYQVTIDFDRTAYLPKSLPPHYDQEEKILSKLKRYELKLYDAGAFLAYILGFLMGVATFRIRPY